jgi:DHA2 family multidrug resistance protein-like MFS transporter
VVLLNVPVMVLLLVLGPLLLPEFRDRKPGPFDLAGAVLSLATILPVIFGIKKIAADGFDWSYLGAIALGVAFGALFLRRMRTAAHPMIDVRLFRRAQFSGAVITGAITFLVLAGIGMFVSQYLQLVLGYGPMAAALWSLPAVAGMGIGVTLATALAARLRPALIVAPGLVLGAAGFALLAQIDAHAGVGWVVASWVVTSAGIGAVATISTDLVLATAPKESAGAGAAISETANEFGGAAGIALLGSLGAVVYRAELTDSAPAGVDLGPAKETLGAAFEVAAELPVTAREELLAAASSSFVTGIHWVSWIGAAGMVVIAAFVLVALRRVPPTGGRHHAQ